MTRIMCDGFVRVIHKYKTRDICQFCLGMNGLFLTRFSLSIFLLDPVLFN